MPVIFRPPRDSGKKRQLAVIALIILVFAAWHAFSPYGAWRAYRISRDLAAVRAENSRLKTENKQLRTEIDRLKRDPAYLEEVARREYGLIKRNEMLFDFSGEKKKKH